VLEVLYHHAMFGGVHPPPGQFFVCLFVCYATFLNVRACAPDFGMKALEYRNDFDTVE